MKTTLPGLLTDLFVSVVCVAGRTTDKTVKVFKPDISRSLQIYPQIILFKYFLGLLQCYYMQAYAMRFSDIWVNVTLPFLSSVTACTCAYCAVSHRLFNPIDLVLTYLAGDSRIQTPFKRFTGGGRLIYISVKHFRRSNPDKYYFEKNFGSLYNVGYVGLCKPKMLENPNFVTFLKKTGQH